MKEKIENVLKTNEFGSMRSSKMKIEDFMRYFSLIYFIVVY